MQYLRPFLRFIFLIKNKQRVSQNTFCFRLLFTCHRLLRLNRSRVNKQVFISVLESLALHAVSLSAEVDAVSAGLFVFLFKNLQEKSNKGYCTTEEIFLIFFLENYKNFYCLNNDFSAKELLHLNRGRCHLSSRREKGNIPILKDITAEERQEIILSKINVEYMNQIYGSICSVYIKARLFIWSSIPSN